MKIRVRQSITLSSRFRLLAPRVMTVALILGAFATFAAFGTAAQAAASTPAAPASAAHPAWMAQSLRNAEAALVAQHGEAQRERAARGLAQIADFWREEDGGAADFEEFARTHFAGDGETHDAMFARFQFLLEQVDGHMNEIGRELRQQSELTLGTVYPFDEICAAYDPGAHLTDDFFGNKIAFVVLLNFPLTTLEERLNDGKNWSRRRWAEVRLAQRFSKRIPADVNLAVNEAYAAAEQYIASYNIWMHHVLDDKGKRVFPSKLRLLTHWNLRDEIKASYSDPKDGLAKQRALQQVMERIVTQTIPACVVDNPRYDWNPTTNEVKPSPKKAIEDDAPENRGAPATGTPLNAPEPDTRYAMLLGTFRASRLVDPYSPTAPTLIARRFDEDREIPEARMESMLKAVLTSPVVPQVAKLIEQRLGRPLEPFDVWYNGFKARGTYTEEELDAITKKKYPTPDAYKSDMPRLLVDLDFTPERAEYLANNIIVDAARGSGHALGAQMRTAKTHLRTRVEPDGMNYKGYNIAVHEMGHNVEQTFSLNDIDHTLLSGVPNNAFTEALAFVFQGRDLELLGLSTPDAKSHALATLHDFWGTFEISGVALVDMAVWHWMYDHPECTAAELRDATIEISKRIWNEYYAPVFGTRDVVLLGIYSHMISLSMYLPDYPIGHLIAFQIEEKMHAAGKIGPEFERVSKIGSVTPDMWMIEATGKPVGPEALLAATERALADLR
ncbi:MAG: hypothetical protein ACKVU1_14945 [bacterium]